MGGGRNSGMAMERRVAKTNYEKMQTGELSNYKDAEIVARNSECVRLMRLARIAR